jgi:CHAD domain-containing protein
MSIILLSDEERKKLTELSQRAPEILLHRARLILAYAAGKPTLQAAKEAGISRGRARFWKRQFIARRMDIFQAGTKHLTFSDEIGKETEATSAGSEAFSNATGTAGMGQGKKQDIPYPEPRHAIGIRQEDSLAEAGRKVWTFHFALMIDHEQGTLQGDDIEELHDMRVATRRMRTAFDIFGSAFDHKLMRHYLKGLRSVGRALGAVRDMDVILEYALDYQGKIDESKKKGLEPLLSAWKESIDKKRVKMTQHLHSEEYQNFKYRFNLFLQSPENENTANENLYTHASLRDVVPVLIYERFAAVRAYESVLPSASIAQLHALRIECKKFRYVLEYFREILGQGVSQAISEIKQLQDHLGELHDMDVACRLVSNFLKGWEDQQISKLIAERDNPEPIVTYLAYLHAKRYELMNTFPQLWARFNRPEFRQNIAQAISVL